MIAAPMTFRTLAIDHYRRAFTGGNSRTKFNNEI